MATLCVANKPANAVAVFVLLVAVAAYSRSGTILRDGDGGESMLSSLARKAATTLCAGVYAGSGAYIWRH